MFCLLKASMNGRELPIISPLLTKHFRVLQSCYIVILFKISWCFNYIDGYVWDALEGDFRHSMHLSNTTDYEIQGLHIDDKTHEVFITHWLLIWPYNIHQRSVTKFNQCKIQNFYEPYLGYRPIQFSACTRQWTGSSLAQVIAYRMFSA